MQDFAKIFIIFFKIGISAFGGGYAMLPLIEKELIDKNNMISKEEFIDFISIAQSTPGPIGVNISILVGYKLKKTMGSIIALFGSIMPSFLCIILVGHFYNMFKDYNFMQGFFSGVNAVVPALLLVSFLSVFKNLKKKINMYIIFALSFIAVMFFKINPIIIILIGGLIGLCIK